MKTKSQMLFDEAFSKPRDPRSTAYKAGVLAALKCECGEGPLGSCPYSEGSAEQDAWLSGLDEGFLIVRIAKRNERDQEALAK